MERTIRPAAVSRRFGRRDLFAVAMAWVVAVGCHGAPNAVLTDLTEARRVAADLRVQFTRASDASDRAVMADTDEASIAFAHEADQILATVRTDVAGLEPLLGNLGYAVETQSLQAFESHFAEYEKIDHSILELAVENTNLKAQRLSFGPAMEAADAFRDALAPLKASKDNCRVESLAGEAVVAIREIQVLQAPHIAESDDAVMTRLEGQMATLNAKAGDAMKDLGKLVDPAARPQLAAATDALDRFDGISKKIVALSRHNSNVRSLELSIRRKPAITAVCDESLRTLQDALAKETFKATR